MKKLNLKKFEIPDLPSKRVSMEAAIQFMGCRAGELLKAGQYQQVRESSDRLPVNVRFVLK